MLPPETPAKAHSPLRVLLLEDDELLRDRVLVPSLKQFGFMVQAIGHASDIEQQMRQLTPDIVVLDVGLPDASGFDVARKLRSEHAGVGIVMLTARGETTDRIRGLSEGADAYLSKPVDIDLLAATLHSLARRLQSTMPAATSARWRLDADGWCLLSPDGQTVALTQLESRVLSPLLQAPNTLVTREALIGAVTTNVHAYDPHRLDSMIHRLRKKVLRVLGRSLPLNAVQGQGYVFVP
ncbi:response regulator transcription factor [Rhodanobacter sp. L36]|uniref:response regulator transcription factor n=1 Tax=Rhodanobacter sp. L36 TaxID=1747221 RepID=UPI00131AE209|nr:response regulator transcription factor [Rhodanobacter sp. L36]